MGSVYSLTGVLAAEALSTRSKMGPMRSAIMAVEPPAAAMRTTDAASDTQ